MLHLIQFRVEGGDNMCGIVGSILGSILGSKSSKASTPSIAAAPTSVNTTTGAETLDAAKSAKQKAAAANGYQSTVATSSSGDASTANTNKKTLLGG